MAADIPQPMLNGGLYTGEAFQEGAPWGNVPCIPDVDYMTNVNLQSASPPPGAIYQYPGNVRPGNNYQKMPGVERVSKLAQACIARSCFNQKKNCVIEPFDGEYSKYESYEK